MLQEFSKRWKAESPLFFNKIKNFCIGTGVTATAVLGLASLPSIIIPVFVTKVASYALIAATAAGMTAKTTVKNPEDLK
jgi:hypothetical protein